MGNIERSQHMTGREGADHVTVAAWRERDAMHERMRLAEDVADALRQQLQGAVSALRELLDALDTLQVSGAKLDVLAYTERRKRALKALG